MDKLINSALSFDLLLDLIEPAGESGKHLKLHLSPFIPGNEAAVKKAYSRLNDLISSLKKDKQSTEELRSILSEVPFLPQTLKALKDRPLFLYECSELKKLVYYARLLQQFCIRHKLDKQYPFENLDKVYALLDPDNLQSPTFALTSAFDKKLAMYLQNLQDLQLKKRLAEHKLMQTAQKSLKLGHATKTLVISTGQTALQTKLNKSVYFQLADENYANLTYKLKDTIELTRIKAKAADIQKKLTQTEERVLRKLSLKLGRFTPVLTRTAELVSRLDWDYAKAAFALKHQCIIPSVTSRLNINVTRAVNLPVSLSLQSNNACYQAIDLKFNTKLNVITGPNMGGKTTALKTAGQFSLMAQYALPVPAQTAELCLFDNVWYNQDDTNLKNLSSFGREVVALKTILRKKGRNLLLMDELAKGTNPSEGEAILMAVLDYIKQLPGLTLAATHFDKPALLKRAAQFAIRGIDVRALSAAVKPGENNLKEQLDLLNSLMDYSLVKLSKGAKPPQNAIPIAEILGLPAEIIQNAGKPL